MDDRPVPPELLAKGMELVRRFHDCFWFWHEPQLTTSTDLRQVVHHLREYGDRRAWRAAQDMQRCL